MVIALLSVPGERIAGSQRCGEESFPLVMVLPLDGCATATIREYLGSHDSFPDEIAVEVLRGDGSTWEQAVIVERVGVDEWTVEYEDGEQAWRDHHELRPAAAK